MCLMLPISVIRADYVFSILGGSVVRLSDDGELLSPLLATGYGDGPTTFIDERVQSIKVSPDGAPFALGNSLGTLTLHRFDPKSGIEDPENGLYSNPISEWSWSQGGQTISGFWTYGSGRQYLGSLSGRLEAGMAFDSTGGVWSIGAIERIELNPQGLTELVYGWGVSRYQLGSDALPVPVLQVTSGPIINEYGASGRMPLWDIDVRPSDSRVFISTDYGLLELGAGGFPTTLQPGSVWGTALAERIADSSHPLSPFHSNKPWMHPLAAEGGWEFGPDELLWSLEDINGFDHEFVRYDPTKKSYSTPFEVVGISATDRITDWFFDDKGHLLVLTYDSLRTVSESVSLTEAVNQRVITQRLHEIDIVNGQYSRLVFAIERTSGFGELTSPLAAGAYLPAPVPEPTAATLVALSVLAAYLRRANLAVR